jgi:3-dehydroquinate synthase
VIKYGCIQDAALFEILEAHTSFEELEPLFPSIIERCVDIKRIIVEHDQFDKGERMLLNFGHTLGHTIEQYFHFERESHGEAVAIGMYQLCLLGEDCGLTKVGTAERILKVLDTYGLPHECGAALSDLLKGVVHDKKNLNGHLNLILLKEIGESFIHQTDIIFFNKNIVI